MEGVHRSVHVVNTAETRMGVFSMLGDSGRRMLVALCWLVVAVERSGAGEAHHHLCCCWGWFSVVLCAYTVILIVLTVIIDSTALNVHEIFDLDVDLHVQVTFYLLSCPESKVKDLLLIHLIVRLPCVLPLHVTRED